MRTDLKVPYAEKDQARKRGARWDAAKKVWFVENVENIAEVSGGAGTPGTSARPPG